MTFVHKAGSVVVENIDLLPGCNTISNKLLSSETKLLNQLTWDGIEIKCTEMLRRHRQVRPATCHRHPRKGSGRTTAGRYTMRTRVAGACTRPCEHQWWRVLSLFHNSAQNPVHARQTKGTHSKKSSSSLTSGSTASSSNSSSS